MDRTAWIAVSLCVIGLVVWQVYVANQVQPKHFPAAGPTPTALFSPAPVASPNESSGSPAPALATATPRPTPGAATFAEANETLSNSEVALHITNRGGGIAQAVLLQHKGEADENVVLNSPEHTPIGALVEDPAAAALPEYKLSREGGAVVCEYTTPQQVTIRKKYSLLPSADGKDNYMTALDIDFRNGGAQAYANTGYFFALGSAVPIHPKDYPSYTRVVWCVDGRAKGVDAMWFGESSGFFGVVGRRDARPVYTESIKGAEWGAVTNQFFATIVAPLDGKADGVWGHRFDIAPEQHVYGVEGAMHMPPVTVPPGQTYTAHFQVWAGPKIYHRLARMDQNQAEIMNFGLFKLISQFLLNFMNWLHSLVRDYGVAILLLTTVIRVVLWPIQAKANRSMRQTALLAPKMQELREKYKDDPTRMNQEVMKLYKQYGINPVGGCLPMMIQIPIFFGLYQMLAQAVELRHQSFLWVHDLSQPDTIGHIPGLGYPINVLPILMAATQVLLMMMTPSTGDPTQRRVMMFTPLIFFFICYNFAAALALYYTAQNLFSILQFYQNKKQPMPTLEKVTPARRR